MASRSCAAYPGGCHYDLEMEPRLIGIDPDAAMFAHFLQRRRTQAIEYCALDGSDHDYREVINRVTDSDITSTARFVTTNHCPNHATTQLNPNRAVKAEHYYIYPAYPMYEPERKVSLTDVGGAIGVLFSGAMLFSGYAGSAVGEMVDYETSAAYLEGDTFDECGCHSSSDVAASYHCHVPPSCLLAQLNQEEDDHSPQIGWAADGFPVYGPRGSSGLMMQSCNVTGGVEGDGTCLDECGGLYKELASVDAYVYRYYVTGEYHDANTDESCTAPVDPLPSEA